MEQLLSRVHRCNDYEREIFGARRVSFQPHMDRWHSELRPDQENNNFFFPTAALTHEDIRAAIALQKERGLSYLMLRSRWPLPESLTKPLSFYQEEMLTMALIRDTSKTWRENAVLEIRDIQAHDIGADLLDVSDVPEAFRAQAYRNMQCVLEVAQHHPEYHWYCGYLGGRRVASVYALRHGGCVEMDDLWVDPAYRKQHIATTMMKHIVQTLPGLLYLHADSSKTPKEMYKKMGFQTVETTFDYYLEWDSVPTKEV